MNEGSEFLVSHGRAAALSRCTALGAWRPQRLDRVVLQSARGLELGDVLGPADAACDTTNLSTGQLIRRATAEDVAVAEALRQRSAALLGDFQREVEILGLPMLALDAELLLDGSEAFVQVLCWGDATVTPLVEKLSLGHATRVRIVDLSRAKSDDHGCSSCGGGGCGSCGEGGCGEGGCAKDSCSSGDFKTADDLTAYFLKLREEMLSHPRVPLL